MEAKTEEEEEEEEEEEWEGAKSEVKRCLPKGRETEEGDRRGEGPMLHCICKRPDWAKVCRSFVHDGDHHVIPPWLKTRSTGALEAAQLSMSQSGCCHALTPGTPHPDPGLSGFPSAWTDGPCADMKPSSGGLAPAASFSC
ncbi:hypothetical protein EYF80_033076 [Liparis tanakae]|uniref:Uncharacterized protein n=1 Tax=Liparis tanakae TaxID=230148 RepID=A0A4Z2GTR9_9TELE|nr:hypothetical protein EYF80_033076 [Liparis tanakae]